MVVSDAGLVEIVVRALLLDALHTPPDAKSAPIRTEGTRVLNPRLRGLQNRHFGSTSTPPTVRAGVDAVGAIVVHVDV